MSDVKIVAARQSQSKADKLGLLKSKKPRTKAITVQVGDEEVELVFKAISSKELDALQAKHKPTVEQRARNMSFNPDTFPPALVAACSLSPKMEESDALEIWESEEWSTGELNHLFNTCSDLCMEGMQVPFTRNA